MRASLLLAAAAALAAAQTSNGGCTCLSSCPAGVASYCDVSSSCPGASSYGCGWLWWDTCYQQLCTRLTVSVNPTTAYLGEPLTVSWDARNVGSTARVELWWDQPLWPDTQLATLASSASVSGPGSLSYTPPANWGDTWGISSTSSFYVYIVTSAGVTIESARFTIRAGTLALSRPAYGDSAYLGPGVNNPLRWGAAHLGGSVTATLMRDTGCVFDACAFSGTVRDLGTYAVGAGGSATYDLPADLGGGLGVTATDHFWVRLVSTANPYVVNNGPYYNVRAPSLTLTAPAPGVTLNLGSPVTVCWSYSGSGLLRLELWIDRWWVWQTDEAVAAVATVDPVNSCYTWTVPSNLGGYGISEQEGFHFRITSLANPTLYDDTDGHNLYLRPGALTITTPGDGGASWRLGDPATVAWSAASVPGGAVRVELYKANWMLWWETAPTLVATLADSVSAAAGSVVWYAPTQPIGGQLFGLVVRDGFFVRVTATANTGFVRETARNVRLLPSLTTETSTAVVGSTSGGYVVSDRGCACTSGCTAGTFFFFQYSAPSCTVAAGDACAAPAASWPWSTRSDGCNPTAGLAELSTIPNPANRSRPIPLTLRGRLAGAQLSAWTVQLLLGDTPLPAGLVTPGAATGDSLAATLIYTAGVVNGGKYFVRVCYRDAYATDYCVKVPVVLVGGVPPRPAPAYHPAVGAAYWHYAHAAYEVNRDALRGWTCAACARAGPLTNVTFITGSVTFAGQAMENLVFVGRTSTGAIVISARGTVGGAQLFFQDAIMGGVGMIAAATAPLYALRSYSGCAQCYVHLGFYAGMDAVADRVADAVAALGGRNASAPDAPSIYLTGHSLGAAMATLLAYELTLARFPVEGVWTFGTPRVGNAAFARSFEAVVLEGVGDGSMRWGAWQGAAALAGFGRRRRRQLQDDPLGGGADDLPVGLDNGGAPTLDGEPTPAQDLLASLPPTLASGLLQRVAVAEVSARGLHDVTELAGQPLPAAVHSRAPVGALRPVVPMLTDAEYADAVGDGGGGDGSVPAPADDEPPPPPNAAAAGGGNGTTITAADGGSDGDPVRRRRAQALLRSAGPLSGLSDASATGTFRVTTSMDAVPHLLTAAQDLYVPLADKLAVVGAWHPRGEVMYLNVGGPLSGPRGDTPQVAVSCAGDPRAECHAVPAQFAYVEALTAAAVATVLSLLKALPTLLLGGLVIGFVMTVINALFGSNAAGGIVSAISGILANALGWLWYAVQPWLSRLIVAATRVVETVTALVQEHFGDYYLRAFNTTAASVASASGTASATPSPSAVASPAALSRLVTSLLALPNLTAFDLAPPAVPYRFPAVNVTLAGAAAGVTPTFTGWCYHGTDAGLVTAQVPAASLTPQTACAAYTRACNATAVDDGLCTASEIGRGAVRTVYTSSDAATCGQWLEQPGLYGSLYCCRAADLCNGPNATRPEPVPLVPKADSGFRARCVTGDSVTGYNITNATATAADAAPLRCFVATILCSNPLAPEDACALLRARRLQQHRQLQAAAPSSTDSVVIYSATAASLCTESYLLQLQQSGYVNASCCGGNLCNLPPSPSPSSTASPSRTASGTPSPSLTGTPSSSSTASGNASASLTASASVSRTPPATASGTASATAAATTSSTGSRTATVTATPSVTVSLSSSRTASASVTGSRTTTVTATPSVTVSLSSSRTASASVTGSRTATVTATPSVTVSLSNSRTASATRTASPPGTPPPSVTATITRSPSLSGTPAATETPSTTAPPTLSSSVSSTPTDTPSTSATLTASPSWSATASLSGSPTASLSASATSSVSGTASLTATGTPTVSRSATPSASVSASVSTSGTASGSETSSPPPTVSATGSPPATQTPTRSGSPPATRSPSSTVTRSKTALASGSATRSRSRAAASTTSRTRSALATRTRTGTRTPTVSRSRSKKPKGL